MSEQLAGQSGTALSARAEPAVWLQPPGVATRTRARRETGWTCARLLADVTMLALAGVVCAKGATVALGAQWSMIFGASSLAGFAVGGLYTPRLRTELSADLGRAVVAAAVAAAAVGALALALSDRPRVGDASIIHWLVASALVCTGRLGVFGAQRVERRRAGARHGRTLVIGAGQVGRLAARRLLDEPQLGLQPIGFLDKEPREDDATALLQDHATTLPVLGASWDLERIVAEQHVDHVLVAFSTAPSSVMLDIVRRCWRAGVDVLVVPRLYEVEGRRVNVEHLGALPVIALRSSNPLGWQFAVKYALDRIVAAFALLALWPVLALIALLVLASSGRPVFFRQQRVGRDGRTFDIFKFRTMNGAPGRDGEANHAWAQIILAGTRLDPEDVGGVSSDDRRTRVGALLRKLSLDELPQLWNVLRGDMSLVGPRPELPHYVESFEDVIYRYPDRHRVKSGLTGWAQIHGLRGNTSLVDRVEWDNFYIENWSPWLDVKILLRTLPAVIARRGAG